jgi:hypothetical protein
MEFCGPCPISQGPRSRPLSGQGSRIPPPIGEAIIHITGSLQIIINKWNDLHNELEVARLSPGSELHIEDNFTLRLQVVFAGRALSYRLPAQSIHQLIGIVDGIVFGIEADAGLSSFR